MKILMLFSSVISLWYSSVYHPIILMILILTQTAMICSMAWIKLKISWFSYILFLIFLGGLMVLFIYITSLASNELMNIKINIYSISTILILVTYFFYNFSTNSQMIMSNSSSIIKTFHFMYTWNSMSLITLTMIYLLLTLIIVVKISNKFEAPIKNLIFK